MKIVESTHESWENRFTALYKKAGWSINVQNIPAKNPGFRNLSFIATSGKKYERRTSTVLPDGQRNAGRKAAGLVAWLSETTANSK